jgi:hypothetical protein
MGRLLLFVTHLTEGFETGFAYSTELARLMEKDIAVLIVGNKRNFTDKVEDLMSAAAFAEANEHEIAREIFSDQQELTCSEEITFLAQRCRETGIKLSIYQSALDIISAIKFLVRQQSDVDLILMGTTITDNGSISTRELKRLLKTASRPIVTIGNGAGVTQS